MPHIQRNSKGEGRPSFLKKRSKKLFPVWGVPRMTGWAPMDRSFLLLFCKKEALSSLLGGSFERAP
jgi:hypothetical protein